MLKESYIFKLSDSRKLRHAHTQTCIFSILWGRLSSGWKNIGVAAVKVGSRHGSVIPVLAENPNYPEEQSAVVMCGQSLKANLSSPTPTCVPPTNTGPKTGRQRGRKTGRKRKRDTEESTVTVMMQVQAGTALSEVLLQTCQCCRKTTYCSKSGSINHGLLSFFFSVRKYLDAE